MATARGILRIAAAMLCALPAVPAAAKFDPAHRWRTLETPHFAVHFHEGCDALAGRAAAIAEEVHARLAPRIGWIPRSRTQLIVADDTDAAEGWATPYPYNQILVSAAAPAGEHGLGTVRGDDWLRLVITHEYAHVLQLDQASRLPLAVRSVFGRLYFPNALQPQWLTEGLATFEETELTAGGRGRSPGAEMVLRMAALADRIPTLDQMAVSPEAWPGGQVPYLFGESFLRFLEGRFGRQRIAELSEAYGGRPLPFLVESTGRSVLGAEYRDLWEEWSAQLRRRFEEQARAVAARPTAPATARTTDGHLNVSPAWSPDGTRLAWVRATGRARAALWVMDADGTGRRRLLAGAFGAGTTLSWSADGGRLYYAKPDYRRGAAIVDDIWAYDFAAGRQIRLTRGLRARDPDPSPDGRSLAVVTTSGGLTGVALLDLDDQLPAGAASRLRLLAPLSADQFSRPRWSPDGRRIAVAVRMPGGSHEIRVLDRDGRRIAGSGATPAIDAAPAWSRDGRWISFSSDRSGIFNVFAWDPQSGDLAQVTNVLGGAFSPAPAPDGRNLAFVAYSARGYDIHLLPPPAAIEGQRQPAPAATPGGESQGAGPPAAGGDAAGSEQAVPGARPYSPRDTIAPRLWIPWAATSSASGTLYGFITGGQDVLQRHRYLLSGLYGPEEERLMHVADYAYDGLRPTIRLLSSDLDRTYSGLRLGDAAADYTERVRSAGVEATFAAPGFERSQALTLGYRYRYLTALTPRGESESSDGELPAVGSLGSTRLAWSYASAHRPPRSVSPEDGQQIQLGAERYQEGLGSERSFTAISLDWRGFAGLGETGHVLAARLFAGGSGGDTPAQGAFGLGGDSPGDVGSTLESRGLPLRGYDQNAVCGERAVLASLEYRFPLFGIDRGGVSLPLFLRRLHGALFVDAGTAWDEGGLPVDELRTGVGAELRLDVFLSYALPLTVRLGFAVGLDEEGGVYPTLGIWMPQGILGAATETHRR